MVSFLSRALQAVKDRTRSRRRYRRPSATLLRLASHPGVAYTILSNPQCADWLLRTEKAQALVDARVTLACESEHGAAFLDELLRGPDRSYSRLVEAVRVATLQDPQLAGRIVDSLR